MSTTVLSIYNAALAEARGRGRLTSLSAPHRELEICNTWYEFARDQVQEGAFWPACRQSARLALLTARGSSDWISGDPETDFTYSFALPTGYLRAWHLDDFGRFSLSFDPTRDRLILSTDAPAPVLVYAARSENPVHWSAGQRAATIYALAGAISGQLSGDNNRVQINYTTANDMLMQAQIASLNSRTNSLEVLPPALAARGYDQTVEQRYYYPFGQLFSVANK